jgi:hypothetical protein
LPGATGSLAFPSTVLVFVQTDSKLGRGAHFRFGPCVAAHGRECSQHGRQRVFINPAL